MTETDFNDLFLKLEFYIAENITDEIRTEYSKLKTKNKIEKLYYSTHNYNNYEMKDFEIFALATSTDTLEIIPKNIVTFINKLCLEYFLIWKEIHQID